jgi:hypothetical protein
MAQLLFATLPPKAAAEKKDYGFDWSAELNKDGDTIAAGVGNSSWAVTPAGVTVNTTDKPKTHDDKTTTVWLDPGSTPSADPYTVTNTIITTQGRIHVGTASLKVVA